MQETTQKQQKTGKKLPELTKKRRDFVDHYVIDENGQEAAKASFNVSNDNSARAVASELLTFPNVINAIEVKRKSLKQALIDKGITEDVLASKVETLLTATDKEGNNDYTAIDKGLKHAASWYGVEDDDTKPKSVSTYNFIFSPENQKDIKEIEARLKARLIQKHESNQ